MRAFWKLQLSELSFSDIAKQTTRVLGRLEQTSRWSELQLTNLQRAARIIEAMAVLVEPEQGQGNNGVQCDGTSVFDRQTCYNNWGVLGVARSSEPHAAMTVSQVHESMESATVQQLRQQQLKFLGTLLRHLQAARGELAIYRNQPRKLLVLKTVVRI